MPTRTSKTETLISFGLLVALIIIAVGILLSQFHYDRQKFSPLVAAASDTLETDESIDTALPGEVPVIIELLPDGYTPLTPLEIYDADTLYEKINGKADLYLNSNFGQLYCRRFSRTGQPELWLEIFIYRMADSQDAFAVYSQQRRTQGIALSFTRFAYQTKDAVFLAAGNYYLEIKGSTLSELLLEGMIALADNFARDIPVDSQLQSNLALFPSKNLVADSFCFYRGNTFGFEGLTDTFTAQYELDGEVITVFFSRCLNPEKAKQKAQQYYDFLIANDGSDITDSQPSSIPGARAVDFYGTIEIVYSHTVYMAGVHAAPDLTPAHNIALALYQNIHKQK